jgi:hypothetical protein
MKFSQLNKIPAHYARHYRRDAERELAYFRRLRTDQDVISRAALAQLPTGKRHSHQRRLPDVALEESRRRLLKNLPSLREAESFDELFEMVDRIIGPIYRIGELAIYDTSLRVGARFGLEPTKVYLHAGTRKGAKALGLDWKKDALEMAELPVELQMLTAREAEDVLCIYKDDFNDHGLGARKRQRASLATSCSGTRPFRHVRSSDCG